ncbi:hypothetical protein MIR68_010640 [Amoeboaphelidium protococcarum]|nr:hypothetical protein MIR68_010640 [Amoeboaphelidium protococcarum]
MAIVDTVTSKAPGERKPISFSNLALGAGLNIFEISTLGQPFEVLKTYMAANRGISMVESMKQVYSRGGVVGFYQGLIPWAWVEASTKGAVLLFTASEMEYIFSSKFKFSPGTAGILAGCCGGIAQAYTTMGFCTFMKTVEITRHKSPPGTADVGSIQIARDILRREGIRGINKGVNAVALRQCTNWGSRLGLSRIAENTIRSLRGDSEDEIRMKKALTPGQKILASTIGGGLSCWNQPIEVIRVEMQSQVATEGRPKKMTIANAAKWIYQNNGLKGFFRGAVPRVGLGAWQTTCMVALGDTLKEKVEHWKKSKIVAPIKK